jgi:glucosylceramidase
LGVDGGRPTLSRGGALDSGGNLGDYARGWELAVSLDGSTWRTIATGTGTGQLTTIDVPRTRARHLRLTTTASAGNWWSVADLRLYD